MGSGVSLIKPLLNWLLLYKCVTSSEKSCMIKYVRVRGGEVVNSERRTWVTIYITMKWDPEHVFLSVKLHDQLMDTEAHWLSLSLLYILSFPDKASVVLWTFFVFSSLTHLRG